LGILLDDIVEEENEGIIDEFHKGICGGHHTSEVNSKLISYRECHIFVGKNKSFFYFH